MAKNYYVDKINYHNNEWGIFSKTTGEPAKEENFLEANLKYDHKNVFGYRENAKLVCDWLNDWDTHLESFTTPDFMQPPHCFPPEYFNAKTKEEADEIESKFWEKVNG